MKRISRRNFLKAAGVGAAALGLAACGSSSSSTGSSTTSSAAASATPAEDVTIKVAAIETGLRLPRCGRKSPKPLPPRRASRWN